MWSTLFACSYDSDRISSALFNPHFSTAPVCSSTHCGLQFSAFVAIPGLSYCVKVESCRSAEGQLCACLERILMHVCLCV